jgi:hypothetical protein
VRCLLKLLPAHCVCVFNIDSQNVVDYVTVQYYPVAFPMATDRVLCEVRTEVLYSFIRMSASKVVCNIIFVYKNEVHMFPENDI